MTDRPIVLETIGLTKNFGGVRAVSEVNFKIHERELRCLVGPNGAGKSTFFKMLSGQIKPSSGKIEMRGVSLVGPERFEIARLGIGIKNQVPDLLNDLSVRENLWVSLRTRHPPSVMGKKLGEMADDLGLSDLLDRKANELAHGLRQRVEIGMVIAREPEIVLLDEPAAGMGEDETAKLVSLIQRINEKSAVIVVEHDMHFIKQIARLVTVFHQGKILKEGNFSEIAQDQMVREVYLGRRRDY